MYMHVYMYMYVYVCISVYSYMYVYQYMHVYVSISVTGFEIYIHYTYTYIYLQYVHISLYIQYTNCTYIAVYLDHIRTYMISNFIYWLLLTSRFTDVSSDITAQDYDNIFHFLTMKHLLMDAICWLFKFFWASGKLGCVNCRSICPLLAFSLFPT